MTEEGLVFCWAAFWGVLALFGYLCGWPSGVIGGLLIVGGLAVPALVIDRL